MTNEQFCTAAQPLMADDRVGMAEFLGVLNYIERLVYEPNDNEWHVQYKPNVEYHPDVEPGWAHGDWLSPHRAAAIIEKHLRDWLKEQGVHIGNDLPKFFVHKWGHWLYKTGWVSNSRHENEFCEHHFDTYQEAIIAAVKAVLEGM